MFNKSIRRIKDCVRKLLGYHDLWMVYLTASDLRPYLWEYRKIVKRAKTLPETCPDVWCNYMIALLECNEYSKFEQIYAEFMRRGGGVKQLKDYFLLSQVAVQKGCVDNEVKRCAMISERLAASHRQHVFEEFVKGKTVAIVGSGPSEKGKGLGAEIDSHDIVIRINNHTVKGFEVDYGSRTDVWAKHTTDYLRHELPDERIRLVVYAANWMRDKLVFGYKDAIERELGERLVDYCDAIDRAPLTEGLNCHPMTGTLLIEKLRRSQMKYLDAYGFSFLQDSPTEYTHYFNDKTVGTPGAEVGVHALSSETIYLRKLFNGGRRLHPLGTEEKYK